MVFHANVNGIIVISAASAGIIYENSPTGVLWNSIFSWKILSHPCIVCNVS